MSLELHAAADEVAAKREQIAHRHLEASSVDVESISDHDLLRQTHERRAHAGLAVSRSRETEAQLRRHAATLALSAPLEAFLEAHERLVESVKAAAPIGTPAGDAFAESPVGAELARVLAAVETFSGIVWPPAIASARLAAGRLA